jgi:hypothetical protein
MAKETSTRGTHPKDAEFVEKGEKMFARQKKDEATPCLMIARMSIYGNNH